MNCDRAHPLIDAYTTDELDLALRFHPWPPDVSR